MVTYETKYFYSQDGARWSDLQPVDSETVKRAGRIKGQLSGDPAKNYELEEKDLNAPPPGEDEEERKLVFQIPELSVLRYRVDSIVSATSIIPTVGAAHCCGAGFQLGSGPRSHWKLEDRGRHVLTTPCSS